MVKNVCPLPRSAKIVQKNITLWCFIHSMQQRASMAPCQPLAGRYFAFFGNFLSFLVIFVPFSKRVSTFSFFLVDNSSLVPLGLIYIVSPKKFHFFFIIFCSYLRKPYFWPICPSYPHPMSDPTPPLAPATLATSHLTN